MKFKLIFFSIFFLFLDIFIFLNISSFYSILLICCITGIAGFWLMKNEDLTIITLIETEILNDRLPTQEILHDLIIWISGYFLILPGIFSDLLGVVLIIPSINSACVEFLRNMIRKN